MQVAVILHSLISRVLDQTSPHIWRILYWVETHHRQPPNFPARMENTFIKIKMPEPTPKLPRTYGEHS